MSLGHDDLFHIGRSFPYTVFIDCCTERQRKKLYAKKRKVSINLTWTYRLILQLWQKETRQHLKKEIHSIYK